MKRKEAIEVVKKNWPDSSFTMLREALETLIPELKESEDENEKIKKAIGYAIGQSTHSDGTLINGVSSEEALAWLEKQAEQNNSDVKDYNSIDPHFGKPADVRTTGYWHVEDIEQKPAWSEEDDTLFKAIIRDIENTKYISEDAKKDRINWLKSLKDRVGCEADCTTTKGWSEEDEAMYQGVIETEQYMLDVVHGRKIFAVGNVSIMGECAKELTWLNSRFKKLLEQLKQL